MRTTTSPNLRKVAAAAANIASQLFSDDPDATAQTIREIQARYADLYNLAVADTTKGTVNSRIGKAVKAAVRGKNANRAPGANGDLMKTYQRFH